MKHSLTFYNDKYSCCVSVDMSKKMDYYIERLYRGEIWFEVECRKGIFKWYL